MQLEFYDFFYWFLLLRESERARELPAPASFISGHVGVLVLITINYYASRGANWGERGGGSMLAL